MAGALMQLVAYGAQDVYLTGNPQITFFKVVYRRHTNFAMEPIVQVASGNQNFGNTVRVKVSRSGDLLHDVFVQGTLPALTGAVGTVNTNHAYVNRVGFALLRSVELRIGGQMIDRHTSTWMYLWSELTTPNEKKLGTGSVGQCVGGVGGTGLGTGIGNSAAPAVARVGVDTCGRGNPGANGAFELLVPLSFSFCRNPGLALPLIALQYHEVELVIELEQFNNLLLNGLNPRQQGILPVGQAGEVVNAGNVTAVAAPTLGNFQVWGNYIFLDTEERKNFAQNPHEYLIETVQEMRTTVNTTAPSSYKLSFNHPVKELVFAAKRANTRVPMFGVISTNAGAAVLSTAPAVLQAHDVANLHTVPTSNGRTGAAAANQFGADLLFGPAAANANTAGQGLPANAATALVYPGCQFTDFTATTRTAYMYGTAVANQANVTSYNVDSAAGAPTTVDNLNANINATNTVLLNATPLVTAHNCVPSATRGAIPTAAAAANAITQAEVVAASAGVSPQSLIQSAVLKLNGTDRFAVRPASYFNRVQPYQHHSGKPDLGICCYSFALKPEEHQPSGTCNFSRIDNADLRVTLRPDCNATAAAPNAMNATLFVYAHGYNVLRVASGMGGLAYSN